MANLGDIMLLGLVVFLFFMVWGMQVFQSVHIAQAYKEQNDGNGFSTFPQAALTLFVTTTTENIPSVMYPPEKYSPWTTFTFFFLFTLGFYFVIMVRFASFTLLLCKRAVDSALLITSGSGFHLVLNAHKTAPLACSHV